MSIYFWHRENNQLTTEIERNLVSRRTKEALARKKSEGFVLGRPKGS
jgi:DNA invertase Pin-like site-specific DNA recombinase